MIRRLSSWAVALLVLGTLAACGGGDDGNQEPDDDPTQSPNAEATASDEPEPEPYLPVPAGVQLTAPGTELQVGESAVIAWQPRQNLVGALEVEVTRLEKTSFKESFEGWDVKAEKKKKVTPYFVHATVTNSGDTNLSGRLVPLYAGDTADTLVEPTKFTEAFKPCPGGSLPKGFSTGDSAKVCMVYLISPGQKLAGVTFRPSQDFEAITWTGEIQRIEKRKKKNKRG